ncbi:MAG: ATP-binding cassette domain-containing protein [Clostridiales Family XIII bacterium]|jgi:peptide/nickel transport system ATP-binding protein|nr:ATP-binding cassette domain-containing protein [Clostridiales Family XIII bacterium]
MSTALLQVDNLKKYFAVPQGYLHAVDDVSFSIDKAATLGVVGESGCGKTTLGRVVLRLLDSTDGRIVFDGEDVTHVKGAKLKALRKRMQIIFQDPYASLNPRKTVFQTISEAMSINGRLSAPEIKKRVVELMDIVGLAQRFVNAYPHELDGGRRQRIGVARALSIEPEFIVCDEPVSALDVSIQAQILNLLIDIQTELGIAYIFITHDLSVVKHISDNIIVMYLGQVVEEVASAELFSRQIHPYTRALLSAVPVPIVNYDKKRILLKGEISSPVNPGEGCRFAPRCDYVQDRCLEEGPELREILPRRLARCHFAERFA